MQNNGTIIVYRSQQEANLDWFLNECLFPWLYNHGWQIVGSMVLFYVVLYVMTRFNKRG